MKYENLLHCLNENNGLIRDWGNIKHINQDLDGKVAIIVENVADAQSLLIPYHNQFDFILSYDSYVKCDCCQKIVDIEDTITTEDGDIICNDCLDNE